MRDIDRQLVNMHRSVICTINKELTSLENTIARMALDDARARRIMTIPGIGHITAITVLAEIQTTRGFPAPKRWPHMRAWYRHTGIVGMSKKMAT